jgi:predicted RNA-binding Zn-ribbon protein involved in translation (DUF1610 family)
MEWILGGLGIWAIVWVFLAVAFFIAPLMIWHHTHATRDELETTNELLKKILAEMTAERRDREAAKKAETPEPEEEPESFNCPHCGSWIPPALVVCAGAKFLCPKCRKVIEVAKKTERPRHWWTPIVNWLYRIP